MENRNNNEKEVKDIQSHYLQQDDYSKNWPAIHIAQVLSNGTVDYAENPTNHDPYRFSPTTRGLVEASVTMASLDAEIRNKTFEAFIQQN